MIAAIKLNDGPCDGLAVGAGSVWAPGCGTSTLYRIDPAKNRISVQINHDTRAVADLELSVVDEVFRVLLALHRREPFLTADAIPVVFIADMKMRRFIEGPRRLLFGNLETDLKKQQEVYVSPTAIFVTEATLADIERLQAALHLGLGYLFDADFYRAVVGLDHATPRPAD